MSSSSSTRARTAVAATFFANGVVFANWVTRIPEVQRRLQLDDAQLGLALFGVAAGCLAAMPAVGALVARWGSGPMTRWFAVAFCLSLPLPALATDLLSLTAALAVFGAANGGMDVAMNAHATVVERAYGEPIMASFHALYSAGGLAGAALGGALAVRGVPALAHFLGIALALAAASLAASRFLLPARTDAGGARAPAFARPDAALTTLAVLAFCVLLSEGAIADWSAVYMVQATGAGAGRAAAAFAAFSLAMAVGRLAGDALTRRFGPVRVVRGGALLAAAGLGAGLVTARPLVSLAGFVCVGLGFSGIFPCLVRAAAARSAAGSAAIAAVATAGYTGFLAGPPVIGVVAQASSVRAGLSLVVLASLVVASLASRIAGAAGPIAGSAAPTCDGERARRGAGDVPRAPTRASV